MLSLCLSIQIPTAPTWREENGTAARAEAALRTSSLSSKPPLAVQIWIHKMFAWFSHDSHMVPFAPKTNPTCSQWSLHLSVSQCFAWIRAQSARARAATAARARSHCKFTEAGRGAEQTSRAEGISFFKSLHAWKKYSSAISESLLDFCALCLCFSSALNFSGQNVPGIFTFLRQHVSPHLLTRGDAAAPSPSAPSTWRQRETEEIAPEFTRIYQITNDYHQSPPHQNHCRRF